MNILKNITKRFKVLSLAVVLAAASFVSTGYVDNYFEISKNLDIFTTLFRELSLYYVDGTDPGKLMKKGIDEMLQSLDPYTVYIPESEMEDHRFMITGQYGGIGALIRKKGDQILISELYEGYASHKANLMAGDILLEIDNKPLKGKSTNDVSKILKGQPGTSLKILIKREGEKKNNRENNCKRRYQDQKRSLLWDAHRKYWLHKTDQLYQQSKYGGQKGIPCS